MTNKYSLVKETINTEILLHLFVLQGCSRFQFAEDYEFTFNSKRISIVTVLKYNKSTRNCKIIQLRVFTVEILNVDTQFTVFERHRDPVL